MKNVVNLRDNLKQLFIDLKDGRIDSKTATEMNNSAGKIINTIKLQLEYHELRGEKPTIDFMDL